MPSTISRRTSRNKRRALVAGAIGVALLCAGVMLALYQGKRMFEQAGEFRGGIVRVEAGSGLNAITAQLHNEGIIEHPRLFRWGVMLQGAQQRLQAGEFEIPANASMSQVVETLAYGRSVSYRITIPEGATSHEIVALLNESPHLSGTIASVPAEGSLLPETYHFERDSSRQDVLRRMETALQENLRRLWVQRADDLPIYSPEEAIILASIVEKETALASERGLIAAVFLNRLKRGMRLQADPTVIYGLTLGKKPLGRPLRRSELQADTPYNSYRRDGLPPTAICNPGIASLEAVLNPVESDLLYFVADGKGGHRFAKSFAQHRRNVAAWRSGSN